jgi:uncharacterized damage-inducible protein DinB
MYNAGVLADNLHRVYYGNNWTDVCLADTLKDISVQQATQRTGASDNTIAALVNHLCFWNEVILQRMQGKNIPIPEQNGMDVAPLQTEEEWQSLVHKMRRSFDALTEAIRLFPANKLDLLVKDRETTIGFNLHGVTEHAYYHLGQIVLLKKMVNENVY